MPTIARIKSPLGQKTSRKKLIISEESKKDVRMVAASLIIDPIPFHPVGTLPVSRLELAMEKLAGPDQTPDFSR